MWNKVGCDKRSLSPRGERCLANGLRILVPGDRKPWKKFLLEISGHFRLLRNFREIDFWWPLVVTTGILREFQNITSRLEFHKLCNGGNFNFRFENLLTSGHWISLIISGRRRNWRQFFYMFLGILLATFLPNFSQFHRRQRKWSLFSYVQITMSHMSHNDVIIFTSREWSLAPQFI